MLTKMLTCTAARPTVAGAMRRADRAQAGIAGRPLRPEAPAVRAAAAAPGSRNCASAADAASRPPSPAPPGRGRSPWPTGTAAHDDRDDVEHRRRERRACRSGPRAFSIPIATAANDTSGRKGSMMRVSATVSLELARDASRSRGPGRATSGPAKTSAEQHDQPPRTTASTREQARRRAGRPRSRPPSCQRARVGGHEGGRERALREEVAQQVRDAEGDLEGVGVEARRRAGPRRPARGRGRGAARRASGRRRARGRACEDATPARGFALTCRLNAR